MSITWLIIDNRIFIQHIGRK